MCESVLCCRSVCEHLPEMPNGAHVQHPTKILGCAHTFERWKALLREQRGSGAVLVGRKHRTPAETLLRCMRGTNHTLGGLKTHHKKGERVRPKLGKVPNSPNRNRGAPYIVVLKMPPTPSHNLASLARLLASIVRVVFRDVYLDTDGDSVLSWPCLLRRTRSTRWSRRIWKTLGWTERAPRRTLLGNSRHKVGECVPSRDPETAAAMLGCSMLR